MQGSCSLMSRQAFSVIEIQCVEFVSAALLGGSTLMAKVTRSLLELPDRFMAAIGFLVM